MLPSLPRDLVRSRRHATRDATLTRSSCATCCCIDAVTHSSDAGSFAPGDAAAGSDAAAASTLADSDVGSVFASGTDEDLAMGQAEHDTHHLVDDCFTAQEAEDYYGIATADASVQTMSKRPLSVQTSVACVSIAPSDRQPVSTLVASTQASAIVCQPLQLGIGIWAEKVVASEVDTLTLQVQYLEAKLALLHENVSASRGRFCEDPLPPEARPLSSGGQSNFLRLEPRAEDEKMERVAADSVVVQP